MKTVKQFIEDTGLATLTQEAFLTEYAALPPLMVHVNAETTSLAQADTDKVHFGTIVLNKGSYTPDYSNPMLLPVYEVKKGEDRNAFAMFITMGRAQNNDLVIPVSQVSKFHAMLTKDLGGVYHFKDVNSTNGSRILLAEGDLIDCVPNQSVPLEDRCMIQLGMQQGAHLIYLANPASVHQYMKGL